MKHIHAVIQFGWLLALGILLLSGCQNEISVLEKEGLSLYESGDLVGALEVFDHAIEQDDQSSRLHTYRGMVQTDLGEIEGAMVDFNQAILLDDKNPDAYVRRGYLRLGMGQYNSAILDFNQALEYQKRFLEPSGLYMTHLNLGTAMNMTGNSELALSHYEAALEVEDQNPDVYNAIGILHRSQGRYETALDYFNLAIEKDDYNSYAYGNRASVFYQLEDYFKALADVQTAMRLDPSIPQLYVILGQIQEALGYEDQALQAYTQGLDLFPGYVEAYLYRATLYEARGETGLAIMDYRLASSYGESEAYVRLMSLYRRTEQWSQAEALLEDYLTDFGRTVGYEMEKGKLDFALGRYEAAIASFDQAIQNTSGYAEPYLFLGYALQATGALELATQAYQQALEIDPNEVRATLALEALQVDP